MKKFIINTVIFTIIIGTLRILTGWGWDRWEIYPSILFIVVIYSVMDIYITMFIENFRSLTMQFLSTIFPYENSFIKHWDYRMGGSDRKIWQNSMSQSEVYRAYKK